MLNLLMFLARHVAILRLFILTLISFPYILYWLTIRINALTSHSSPIQYYVHGLVLPEKIDLQRWDVRFLNRGRE